MTLTDSERCSLCDPKGDEMPHRLIPLLAPSEAAKDVLLGSTGLGVAALGVLTQVEVSLILGLGTLGLAAARLFLEFRRKSSGALTPEEVAQAMAGLRSDNLRLRLKLAKYGEDVGL